MSDQTLDIITQRRSIRSYRTEQITEEELKTVLEAGIYAPSAGDQQPWHFTAVHNRAVLERLSKDARSALRELGEGFLAQAASREDFHAFHHAPTAILISGDPQAMCPQVDCSAAAENMLIAAEALGLGSCWVNMAIHLFESERGEAWKQELGIPTGYTPRYAVALGYKAQAHPKASERRDGTVTIIREE